MSYETVNAELPLTLAVPLVMLGGGEVPPQQQGTKTTPPTDSVKHSLQEPRASTNCLTYFHD